MLPTKKIKRLTTSQESRLVEYREEWLAIGRSTEPADRPKAEAAIGALYALIGEAPPYFWWVDGPAVGSLVKTIFRDNLGANLGANLRDNLVANLWDNLGANLRTNLRANLFWHFWGQHESAWPAYYHFCDSEIRPMYSQSDRSMLGYWLDCSRSMGWWDPFCNVVFLCERPQRQLVDDRGFLHSGTGPAILCRDGWPVYAWHGVRVDAQIIDQPDTITSQQVLAERNAEVRRVMIERMGLDRFISQANGRVLHTDQDGKRVLHRIQMEGDEPIVAVQVQCPSTGQVYFLRVPPQMDKCDKAVAWTFGFERVEEYQPIMET